jgi:hypothetical protein
MTTTVRPTPTTRRPRAIDTTARAYCGQAHGRVWLVDPSVGPEAIVWLPNGVGLSPYRVVLQPKTSRPARDHLGNYVYLPARISPDD